MRVKRRARRAAYRRGATDGWAWRPIGWFQNRPWILQHLVSGSIGRMESVRLITSPLLTTHAETA